MSKKVAVIMGSDSDLDTMRPCIQRLKSFGIPTEVHIISAHRTPAAAERFASQARENGFGAIIAAAGKAAHLAGVLAAYTTLPVIGVPIKTSMMGGLDSLLSTQMLALSDEALSDRLVQFKAGMAAEVEAKDHKIQMEEF